MKAKIKREWEASVDGKLIPCKFEEDVILSDKIGFNKSKYNGWYVSDEDLNEDGIYTKYWHHSSSYYKSGILREFDVTKCRKIKKSSLLN